jgi:cyclopropane fatty-acyl-phospholipid synthase-like methyltransferase
MRDYSDHRPGTPAGADHLYAGTPPWDIGRPQPAFADIAQAGLMRGRVLDAGCGTGEHTLMAAALGLDATGVDLAPTALEAARRKARDRGLAARFLCHDARNLAGLGESFDTVLDCGLFHIFGDDDRAAYTGGLRAVTQLGGRFFLLCFSDSGPANRWGHVRRVSMDEIITSFADGWQVASIEPARLDITTDPGGVPAWLAALTRI